jgi:hypothetical protein
VFGARAVISIAAEVGPFSLSRGLRFWGPDLSFDQRQPIMRKGGLILSSRFSTFPHTMAIIQRDPGL